MIFFGLSFNANPYVCTLQQMSIADGVVMLLTVGWQGFCGKTAQALFVPTPAKTASGNGNKTVT